MDQKDNFIVVLTKSQKEDDLNSERIMDMSP